MKERHVTRAAKKGFLIVNRPMADAAFRDNMPDDRFVEMAREQGLYAKRASDESIWVSLHMLWRVLDE